MTPEHKAELTGDIQRGDDSDHDRLAASGVLTQEGKRIKIAEACGIKITGTQHGIPFGLMDGDIVLAGDYLNSLGSMHEAEKMLTDAQRAEYAETLYRLIPAAECFISASYEGDHDFEGYFGILHATAAQRAEAFGKTLKLW